MAAAARRSSKPQMPSPPKSFSDFCGLTGLHSAILEAHEHFFNISWGDLPGKSNYAKSKALQQYLLGIRQQSKLHRQWLSNPQSSSPHSRQQIGLLSTHLASSTTSFQATSSPWMQQEDPPLLAQPITTSPNSISGRTQPFHQQPGGSPGATSSKQQSPVCVCTRPDSPQVVFPPYEPASPCSTEKDRCSQSGHTIVDAQAGGDNQPNACSHHFRRHSSKVPKAAERGLDTVCGIQHQQPLAYTTQGLPEVPVDNNIEMPRPRTFVSRYQAATPVIESYSTVCPADHCKQTLPGVPEVGNTSRNASIPNQPDMINSDGICHGLSANSGQLQHSANASSQSIGQLGPAAKQPELQPVAYVPASSTTSELSPAPSSSSTSSAHMAGVYARNCLETGDVVQVSMSQIPDEAQASAFKLQPLVMAEHCAEHGCSSPDSIPRHSETRWSVKGRSRAEGDLGTACCPTSTKSHQQQLLTDKLSWMHAYIYKFNLVRITTTEFTLQKKLPVSLSPLHGFQQVHMSVLGGGSAAELFAAVHILLAYKHATDRPRIFKVTVFDTDEWQETFTSLARNLVIRVKLKLGDCTPTSVFTPWDFSTMTAPPIPFNTNLLVMSDFMSQVAGWWHNAEGYQHRLMKNMFTQVVHRLAPGAYVVMSDTASGGVDIAAQQLLDTQSTLQEISGCTAYRPERVTTSIHLEEDACFKQLHPHHALLKRGLPVEVGPVCILPSLSYRIYQKKML